MLKGKTPDLSERYAKLSEYGDPLERVNAVIDWSIFSPLISIAFRKQRKSAAGRKPYNRLMMFKVLVLQSLYSLSDGQTEYQIRDRLSFVRFLGLKLTDQVPDEKTIWLYRDVLTQSGMLDKLFDRLGRHLEQRGYGAATGTIVDATIIEVPKQRNSRDVNKQIKKGEVPDCITENPSRARQKDIDARWTVKNNVAYYGYKNHINIDVEHKLIREYGVTTANVSDINCFTQILNNRNTDNKVWADSAYYSEKIIKELNELGFESRIISKHKIIYPEWSSQSRENSRRSKIRKRVEHVFGFMQNSMKSKVIRGVGFVRAKAKITMMNITYNLCRLEQLERLGVS